MGFIRIKLFNIMKIVRELFIIYFFLFYSYFYFSIDEEFMVFIVIFLWLLFFLAFYLKSFKYFFKDNIMFLIDEYFFFHNKRNLFLSIIRDQYYDIIFLNNFINFFISSLILKINKTLNKKIINFHKKDNVIISERLNFLKSNLKVFLISNYLTIFSFFYKLLSLLLLKKNNCFNFFFSSLYNLKKQFEFKNLNNKILLEENSLIFYKNLFKKIFDNKTDIILNKSFIFQQILILKLKKVNNFGEKKKKIFKILKILKLILKLRNVILVKKIKVKPRKWFFFKKI